MFIVEKYVVVQFFGASLTNNYYAFITKINPAMSLLSFISLVRKIHSGTCKTSVVLGNNFGCVLIIHVESKSVRFSFAHL